MTTRALFNLLMVTALAYAARSFLPAGMRLTGSGAALAFGFLLIAALQLGHLADRLRSPQLTGYLLCGLLFGPQVLGIVSDAMLEDLDLIEGTAVGLIALLAGCELNFRRLRPALRAITSISAITIITVILALWALFLWIVSVLPATAGYGTFERAAIALVAANVLAAFSPAVVIGLISETRASGPLSQLCMSIVVIGDLAMVVTFAMTTTLARTAFPSTRAAGGLDTLLTHIFGSILVGVAVGAVLAIYVRRVHSRTGLVVFALLFVVAEAGRALHLDPLLVGLAAGLLIENASPVSGEEIVRSLAPVTLTTFAIFFAVVGAEIDLRAFLHVAPFAIVAAIVRAIGIYAGSHIGSVVGRVPRSVARFVPLGLLPQAGVAIALAGLVLNDFQPWGRVVGTVIIGSIVVNQLVSPVLFRIALSRAGEIGKGAPLDEMASEPPGLVTAQPSSRS
jgi:Kef-type K+ transport system membrane component KefB